MPAQKADTRLVHTARKPGPAMELDRVTVKNDLNDNIVKIQNIPAAEPARPQAAASVYIQAKDLSIFCREHTMIRAGINNGGKRKIQILLLMGQYSIEYRTGHDPTRKRTTGRNDQIRVGKIKYLFQ